MQELTSTRSSAVHLKSSLKRNSSTETVTPTPSPVVVDAPSFKVPAVTMTAISHGTASGNPTKLINQPTNQ